MPKRVVFAFDERSQMPLDKIRRQHPDCEFTELVVRNPETGEERAMVIRKEHAAELKRRDEMRATFEHVKGRL